MLKGKLKAKLKAKRTTSSFQDLLWLFSQFGQILSWIGQIRTILWLFKKLLHLYARVSDKVQRYGESGYITNPHRVSTTISSTSDIMNRVPYFSTVPYHHFFSECKTRNLAIEYMRKIGFMAEWKRTHKSPFEFPEPSRMGRVDNTGVLNV
jgi:hypothetical protein